ncbi:hypothetical protein ACFL3F_04435, partial [Planctomycetota bacterium]
SANTNNGPITLAWNVDAGTPVDVWVGTKEDLSDFTKVVDKQAVTSFQIDAEKDVRYFWAVDTYAAGAEEPNLGPVFDFLAENVAPVVDVGDDVTTWVVDGSIEVALSGTVADTDPTTTLWTIVSEPDDPNSPDAVITDPAALETTITCSALGDYVIQLEANDGERTSTDTMTINVFADSCLAAQSLPGYEFLVGDINQDCIVDDLDRAILLDDWMNCTALDCPDPNAL